MANNVFDPTIGALNTSLNLRLMNQNIISSNIANADTPEYKAKRLEFEQAFRQALGISDQLPLQTSDSMHIAPQEVDPVYPQVYNDPNGIESLDGNTVNRADEMARMTENQLLYSASAEMLKKKLGMLKYAVSEGGGNR